MRFEATVSARPSVLTGRLLHRTTSIETDLLRIQAEVLRDRQHLWGPPDQPQQRQNVPTARGNPQAKNLFGVLGYLQKRAGVQVHVRLGA